MGSRVPRRTFTKMRAYAPAVTGLLHVSVWQAKVGQLFGRGVQELKEQVRHCGTTQSRSSMTQQLGWQERGQGRAGQL